MNGRDWLNAAVEAAHLAASVGWLAMLLVLALLTWLARGGPDGRRAVAHDLRRRLLVPLWAFIAIVAVTAVYNRFENAPFAVPLPWELGEATVPWAREYGLLLLGKEVLLAQMVLALAVVTRRLATARADDGESGAEMGAALVLTFSLVSGLLVVATAALLGYVHVIVPDHTH